MGRRGKGLLGGVWRREFKINYIGNISKPRTIKDTHFRQLHRHCLVQDPFLNSGVSAALRLHTFTACLIFYNLTVQLFLIPFLKSMLVEFTHFNMTLNVEALKNYVLKKKIIHLTVQNCCLLGSLCIEVETRDFSIQRSPNLNQTSP